MVFLFIKIWSYYELCYVQVKIVVWNRWQASESSRSDWLACTLSWEHSKSYSHHSVRRDYGKVRTTWVLLCPVSSGLARALSDSTPSTTRNIHIVYKNIGTTDTIYFTIFIPKHCFGFVTTFFIYSKLSLEMYNIKLVGSFYYKLRRKFYFVVCGGSKYLLFLLSTLY